MALQYRNMWKLMRTMNYIVWFVFYYILLIVFVGLYNEYHKKDCMSNIKFTAMFTSAYLGKPSWQI